MNGGGGELGLGEGDGLGDGEGLEEKDGLGDGDGLGLGDGLGDGEGLGEGDKETLEQRDGDRDGLGEGEGEGEGEILGLGDGDGEGRGEGDGLGLGDGEGLSILGQIGDGEETSLIELLILTTGGTYGLLGLLRLKISLYAARSPVIPSCVTFPLLKTSLGYNFSNSCNFASPKTLFLLPSLNDFNKNS